MQIPISTIGVLLITNAVTIWLWIRRDLITQRNYDVFIDSEKEARLAAKNAIEKYCHTVKKFDTFLYDNKLIITFREWDRNHAEEIRS